MSCLRRLVQKGKKRICTAWCFVTWQWGHVGVMVSNKSCWSQPSELIILFQQQSLLIKMCFFLFCFLQEESNGWAYWKGNVVEYKRFQSSSGNVYKQWTQLGHSSAAEETVPQQGASSKKWSIFQFRSTAPLVNVVFTGNISEILPAFTMN